MYFGLFRRRAASFLGVGHQDLSTIQDRDLGSETIMRCERKEGLGSKMMKLTQFVNSQEETRGRQNLAARR
jgi:hypothetical protein